MTDEQRGPTVSDGDLLAAGRCYLLLAEEQIWQGGTDEAASTLAALATACFTGALAEAGAR